MRWSEACQIDDDGLRDAVGASLEFRPDLVVSRVLRHVPGRRVTALGISAEGPVVVKVFHHPRARGNQRRLTALSRGGLGGIVPRGLGCDPSGRIGVISHRPGEILTNLPDRRFVTACAAAGAALRRVHDSPVDLDRTWHLDDELAQLTRMAPPSLRSFTTDIAARAQSVAGEALVPAHRDLHPRQVVARGGRGDDDVALIDFDDCAMAPRGLDVGNMTAHLILERVAGRRDAATESTARGAFLAGYGWSSRLGDLDQWERLALVRLAGLAESRHRRPHERDALVSRLAAVAT